MTGKHCSIGGRFHFPEPNSLTGGEYGFGYWLEITDSASPAPGGTVGLAQDGNFYAALHVANGPNLLWTSVTMTTKIIEGNEWYYIVGSFRTGRRGEVPEMTICVDTYCQTDGLKYHSNDILGYIGGAESGFHLGRVYSGQNSLGGSLSAAPGTVDELIIRPSYMTQTQIVNQFNLYAADYPKPTVTVLEPQAFYDPQNAITLRAEVSILEQQNNNDIWTWEFTAPTGFTPVAAMVSTRLNDRAISFVPNALEAGKTYTYRVCAIIPPNSGACSPEYTFRVELPPVVSSVVVECFEQCNNGAWTAEESNLRITALATASAGAELDYSFYTEQPQTQNVVPISTGFVSNSIFETANGLPNVGVFPSQEVTIYAEAKDRTTGFVGKGFRVIVLQPPSDSASATTGFQAIVGRNTGLDQLLAGLGALTGGPGLQSRMVATLAVHPYLNTYINLANALMTEKNNQPGAIEWTAFSLISTLLSPLPTEAQDITNTVALMKRIVTTQLVPRHIQWRLETTYFKCIDQLQSATTALATDATQQTLFTNIQELRMLYLNFIAKNRAITAPAYVVRSSASTSAATEKVKFLLATFPQVISTPLSTGSVSVTTRGSAFQAGTKEVAISVTLSPNVFTSAAFTPVTDTSVSVTNVVDIQMSEGIRAVVVPNAYDVFVITIPCQSCLANDPKVYRCGILAHGATQWIDTTLPPTVSAGAIQCTYRGDRASGRVAAFVDTSAVRTAQPPGSTPLPQPPVTEAPLFTPVEVTTTTTTPYASFSDVTFIRDMAASINTATATLELLEYCSSDNNGIVDRTQCRQPTAAVARDVSVLAGEWTWAKFKFVTSDKQSQDALVAALKALAEACKTTDTGALGAVGLCPAPGTTMTFTTPDTAAPGVTPGVSSNDDGGTNWAVMGPVIAVVCVAFLLCIVGVVYCSKKGYLCFSSEHHGARELAHSGPSPVPGSAHTPSAPDVDDADIELSHEAVAAHVCFS